MRPAQDGLRVAVRLSPRSKADRLLGIVEGQSGRVVKASVTAPAEGGRANEALLQMLARTWDLPRRDLSVVAGVASRNKVVRIAGDPRQFMEKIASRISGLAGR